MHIQRKIILALEMMYKDFDEHLLPPSLVPAGTAAIETRAYQYVMHHIKIKIKHFILNLKCQMHLI